jgi:hypothetical protein
VQRHHMPRWGSQPESRWMDCVIRPIGSCDASQLVPECVAGMRPAGYTKKYRSEAIPGRLTAGQRPLEP